MAAGIGPGGNFFNQINQQIARGPEGQNLENLRHTGGTANNQRKTSAQHKGKGVGQEEGFTFSEAAHKSLQTSHQEHIQGHEHELVVHAGLQESEPENNENHELRVQRGHERDQEEKAEKSQQRSVTVLPDGWVRITSTEGVESVLQADQFSAISSLDGNMQDVCSRLLGDIPEANLEAAERVLDNQMKTDNGQITKLKPVPEAQEAGRMELKAARFLESPLDIRQPGNDSNQPMTLEFPDSELQATAAQPLL